MKDNSMTDSGIITIKRGREKPVRNQHPWIFSGAIARAEHADDGTIVTVVDDNGSFLARGYWNHKSQIQVRLLTWQDEPVDSAWWQRIVARAVDARIKINADQQPELIREGVRLINAENDGLPGLVVDYYAGWVVLQALTLYIDQHKHDLSALLVDVLRERGIPVYGVYERSDVDVRAKEGLKEATGVLWGDTPPQLVIIEELHDRFMVDVYKGHKTGFYLDQADNRQILADLVFNQASNRAYRLLNLFSYTGSFGLRAVSDNNAASVVNVDSSAEALQLADEMVALNDYKAKKFEQVQADVFDYLRDVGRSGEMFDMVVLDPPKFAHNKQQIDRASRGYKDLNLNAFKVVKSGGYLMTFSCSGAIDRDLFQKIVFGALADSGRSAQIVRFLHASSDHPVALTFPEGEYLKGLLLRVW